MALLLDYLTLVAKQMIEKKKQVFLTIAGIIIGIFTFTFFLFVSQGLSNAITEQFSSLGLNTLTVQSFSGAATNGPPSGEGLTETQIARITQVVDDLDYIAPSIFYTGLFEYGREQSRVTTVGFPDEYLNNIEEDFGIEMEEGRFLRQGDQGVIVLGNNVVDQFGERPVSIGTSLKFNGSSYRVIGIVKDRGDLFLDSSAYVSFDDSREISGQDTYTQLRVSFYEGTDLQEMQQRIEDRLNPANGEKVISVSSPQQAIEQFNEIIGVLSLIIGFVSFIALLVGGINVMNSMYSNVLERINEISVFKAIGAKNEDILILFLIESSILGLIGALLGFAGAYGLAELLSYIIINYAGFNVPVYWNSLFFIEIVGATTIAAMLFGTYPAVKASKVDPADNLRDE